MQTVSDKAAEAKWEAKNDLRTLIGAEEILADKKRRVAAMKMKREEQKALANLDRKDM
jgi:hypothetical protein